MTVLDPNSKGRWQYYVLEHGAGLNTFLQYHLNSQERDILFVLGKGFDPRMCVGIDTLLQNGGVGKRDILVIDFPEGVASPSEVHQPLVQENWTRLQDLE